MNNSIYQSNLICNSLKQNNFDKNITDNTLKYITNMLISIFSNGYRGKIVDFQNYSDYHRTSISRFLRNNKLDFNTLKNILKQNVIHKIYEESKNSKKPILCIIDDTIISKTKPSSKAINPIEDAYFHYSHLDRKCNYGHQAVGVMLSCNGITLNYDIIMYDKSKSKIDIVKEIVEELPIPPVPSYFLCDSWYVCEKLISAFLLKGFYTIGALKSNRVIYPNDVKLKVKELAKRLDDVSFFHIVTMKGHKYHVFRYEGKLNGIENATVLLTYPVGAFGKSKSLRAFISTDIALSDEEILNFYTQRWQIEIFFRDLKSKLFIDKCQIRSSLGIQHFWLIISIAYFISCYESKSYNFSEGFALISKKINIERFESIFDIVKNCKDKSTFLFMVA